MTDRDSQPPSSGEATAPTEEASTKPEGDVSSDRADPVEGAPKAVETGAVAGPASPPAAPTPSYAFLAVVSIVTLAADLASKHWAKVRLSEPKLWSDRRIDVIKDYFSFIFARNRGGAWGLLQDEPESIRRPFFLGISALAIIFIVSLYRKLTPQQWALKWGLPLVLGGALGNLVNRIQFNYVVDFIDLSYKGHHWPTFNVADIAIVAGVGLMAVDMFTPRRASTPAVAAASPPSSQPSVDAAREAAPKVEAGGGDTATRET